jgi:hypothetical protein
MRAIVLLDVHDLTDGGGRTGTNNLGIVSRPRLLILRNFNEIARQIPAKARKICDSDATRLNATSKIN